MNMSWTVTMQVHLWTSKVVQAADIDQAMALAEDEARERYGEDIFINRASTEITEAQTVTQSKASEHIEGCDLHDGHTGGCSVPLIGQPKASEPIHPDNEMGTEGYR